MIIFQYRVSAMFYVLFLVEMPKQVLVCLNNNEKDGYRQRNVRQFLQSAKAHFGLLLVRPWDNRGKCHMDEKRIQYLSNASQHVPIYLQPFSSNSTRKFKSSQF